MQLSKSNKNIDFESSFKEHYAPLCRYAYSIISDQDLCEDLVQDIFLKIWDKNPEINSSLSSYLYRAVKNACINEIKKKMQQTNLAIEEVEDPIYTPFDLNRENNLSTIQIKVTKAIENLPPRCKEIFIMRRNMQMSYDEISEQLNISKKTIENQMNSAIKKLRAQLSKSDLLIYFIISAQKNKA